MSDARVVAWLEDGERDPSLMTVGPAGRAIVLDIPAGVELRGASLTLEAPGDDVTLDVQQDGVTLVTSNHRTQLPDPEGAEWVSVDWGTRRPLTSLTVTATGEASTRGRLSVAEGGPWYPAMPFDTFVLQGQEQSLPGITASRLLVEFVQGPPDPVRPQERVKARVSSVVVKAAARPADLSASLDSGAPFFHQTVPMRPREALTLGDSLHSALQRAWPASREAGRVTLALRSSATGKLRRLELVLDTLTVRGTWRGGGESLTLPVSTDGAAVGPIEGLAARRLHALSFLLRYQSSEERVPLTPRPEGPAFLAHHCGTGSAAAQAFAPPPDGAPLVGVDLHLRPLTRELEGTLTLHADASGRPAAEPLEGATLALSLVQREDAPWAPGWVTLEATTPVRLPATTWWAVLTVSEGAVLWTLDSRASESSERALAPLTALYRTEDSGPWLPRVRPTGPEGAGLWALTRPRLRASSAEPPPVPRVTLRWGTARLEVTPDETGRVSLDERALQDFVPSESQPPPVLEVVVQSQVSGTLTLSALRVTSAHTESFALFPLK